MLKILQQTNVNFFGGWINALKKTNATYNFIFGGRNGHKSTDIQREILNDYLTTGATFLLIRRKTDEIVSDNWFTPYIRDELLKTKKLTITFRKTFFKNDKYTGYFFLADENGKNEKMIGKVCYLSIEQKYKSNESPEYQNLKNVVFEEFIATEDKAYLKNEPQTLVNLISTFFRSRNANIYFIGNTLKGQQNNPYFRFFEIDEIELQVDDIYIIENEYNVKILLAYVANILNDDIPEYQKIKNNSVGTTGEWEQDKNLLTIPLKEINGTVKFLNFVIVYREVNYYVYEVKEKNFTREYLYITNENQEKINNNFETFKNNLPPEHKNYSISLLANIYSKFFDYSFEKHCYVFIPPKQKYNFTTLKIDNYVNEKEKSKENFYNKLEQLDQILYNRQTFCSNKSLLYWLKNEKAEYIKELTRW